MRPVHRRTSLAVRGGLALRKNRADLSPHYSQTDVSGLVIDRRRPGAGYRHVLTIEDVHRFLDLLPDRDALLDGLRAIVLDEGSTEHLGWCDLYCVAVCAWERDLERTWHKQFVTEHAELLQRLGVERSEASGPFVRCRFTPSSARGFLLMHILLHELGHHRDRMTNRSRQHCARGERFAEDYANRMADRLWNRYYVEFGW
ncbi:MAG: hypothetical protein WBC44_02280 [Planctomycetaceae bacterium]